MPHPARRLHRRLDQPRHPHNLTLELSMCRFLAYHGEPIPLETLVAAPRHSLIHQPLHASEAKTRTNGDGFGVGWYGERPGLSCPNPSMRTRHDGRRCHGARRWCRRQVSRYRRRRARRWRERLEEYVALTGNQV